MRDGELTTRHTGRRARTVEQLADEPAGHRHLPALGRRQERHQLRDAEHFPLVGLYSRRPTDAGGRKPHENRGVATLAE